MKKITLWAPKALEVSLCLKDSEIKMEKNNDGYFSVKLPDNLKKPILYAFKVNGKGPYPDPASKYQPDGVHGFSQYWDNDYKWNDEDCQVCDYENAIIYELHTGTFSPQGTYQGIIDRLDYLVNLGITHIEVLPVAAFPGKQGWGYDGVGLYATHNAYGDPDELKKLVDCCHQKGLGVILDVVYNHLGPDGNYLEKFGPYFTDRYGTPWGKAINFDSSHSDHVRKFCIENALMWLRDYHFDGLRLDAIHAIFDFSATHILEEMQQRVEELSKTTGRKYSLIAESDLNDPRIINKTSQGGYGLAGQWLDDFHHCIHKMLTGETMRYYKDYNGAQDIDKCMKKAYLYDGIYSLSRKRSHGRAAEILRPEQFVVFIQNHDQTGNRALGERLNHLVSVEKCMAAAALMMMSPFTPMLFQGEEWAASTPFLFFTDHEDENLAQAIRKGRARECAFMGVTASKVPDPQAYETFKRSCLNWDEIDNETHSKMLNWYKKLINIRKQHIDQLRSNNREFKIVARLKKLYTYSAGNIVVLMNLGKKEGQFSIDKSNFKILAESSTSVTKNNELILKPESTVIIRK